MNHRSVIGLLAAMMIAGGTSEARQAPQFTETASVTVIEVPVTVTDRSGKPVTDLSVDQFEVYDDGRKVPITYFETVDLEAISGNQSARINPVAQLNLVILFDLSYSSPGNLDRARRAATEFIETQMTGRDRASVATYNVETGFHIITSFTSDVELLKLAVQTLGHPRFFRPADPLLLSASPSTSVADPVTGGFENESEAIAIAETFAQINQGIEDRISSSRLERQFASFAGFARLLESVRGRKQVIMLSEGFDPRLVQGKEASTAENIADMEAIASGEPWRVSSDDRYGPVSTKRELRRMGEIFRRTDVVLHAVDIKGVRTKLDTRGGSMRDSNEALHLMTEPTGGSVFKNSNDLASNLSRLIRQQRFVYVLGFHARAAGEPGRFHELDVRLSDVSGARVSHRAGYHEPSGDLTRMEKTLTAADILLNDIPQDAVGVATVAVPFRAEEGLATVPVIVEIGGAALAQGLSETGRLVADLFVYAFDPADSLHDFRHQKIEIDLAKAREPLVRSGIKFYGTLRLPPGEYRIRTLVAVEQTGLRGFDRTDIRVSPSESGALLPPLVLEEEGKWIMVKAEPREAAEVPYPFHFAGESFVPSALPVLEPGETNRLAIFAYDLDFEQAELRAGIRTPGGEMRDANIKVVGRAPEEDGEPAKLMLTIETDVLEPGRYLFDFAVDLGNGNERFVTSQPFEIIERVESEDASSGS